MCINQISVIFVVSKSNKYLQKMLNLKAKFDKMLDICNLFGKEFAL